VIETLVVTFWAVVVTDLKRVPTTASGTMCVRDDRKHFAAVAACRIEDDALLISNVKCGDGVALFAHFVRPVQRRVGGGGQTDQKQERIRQREHWTRSS
jgi:hypothetical protein